MFQLSLPGVSTHVTTREHPAAEGGTVGGKCPVILPKWLHAIYGYFTCRKGTTWDRRLYFPSEGRCAEDFFCPKNPTASARCEPANLGTKGQHAISRLPKPRVMCISHEACVCYHDIRWFRASGTWRCVAGLIVGWRRVVPAFGSSSPRRIAIIGRKILHFPGSIHLFFTATLFLFNILSLCFSYLLIHQHKYTKFPPPTTVFSPPLLSLIFQLLIHNPSVNIVYYARPISSYYHEV